MRGGFVACLGASCAVEPVVERLRWHRGRAARQRVGKLDVASFVDAVEGPMVETRGGTTLLVHGASPAPLAELQRTAARFAALEWDGQRLRASRDALGLAPLFYRRLADAIWFATEVAPLVSLERPVPDLEALSARAAFVPLDDRTGWRGIHRVLPGTTVVVDGRDLSITETRHWTPASCFGSRRGSRDEALAEFRERFGAAVRNCFDHRSGILLSGGLDSGAVAVTATALGLGVPHLVHVNFAELPETDERRFATALADSVGAPLQIVSGKLTAWDVASELDLLGVPYNRFPYGIDEPALGHLAAQGIAVALDGHDADGVLGPRGVEWGVLLLQGEFNALTTLRRKYGLRRGVRGSAADLLPSWLRPPGLRRQTYMQSVAPYFCGPLRRRIEHEDIFRWCWPTTAWKLRQFQPLLPRASVSFEQKELEAASYGIDLRHPFADRALVDFLISLPCAVKSDPGRAKPLLVDALDGLFPAVLRERPKSDYGAVVRRRVEPEQCLEAIRAAKVCLPGVDYRRLFDDAASKPQDMPLFMLVNLARVHEFARRAV